MGGVLLTGMSVKKTKLKKKAMTLEDFAVAIQKDYLSLRKDVAAGFAQVRTEMATKDDLQALRDETKKEFAGIREQMATKEDLSAVSDRFP
jgi:hypothetical protein